MTPVVCTSVHSMRTMMPGSFPFPIACVHARVRHHPLPLQWVTRWKCVSWWLGHVVVISWECIHVRRPTYYLLQYQRVEKSAACTASARLAHPNVSICCTRIWVQQQLRYLSSHQWPRVVCRTPCWADTFDLWYRTCDSWYAQGPIWIPSFCIR